MEVRLQPLGDQAVRVEFGSEISPELNGHLRGFCRALERAAIAGVVEWVPAYTTVAVYYRPREVRYLELCDQLRQLEEAPPGQDAPARIVEIPVRYGGDHGPDLDSVAEYHGITPAEVVALHSGPTYLVYMLGFVPGFPYLGGLPERIATPRLATPRAKVPAGSVGIAGTQTGIYPLETPGGWRIIGQTALALYDLNRRPAALLHAGDYVKFVSVSEDADAAG